MHLVHSQQQPRVTDSTERHRRGDEEYDCKKRKHVRAILTLYDWFQQQRHVFFFSAVCCNNRVIARGSFVGFLALRFASAPPARRKAHFLFACVRVFRVPASEIFLFSAPASFKSKKRLLLLLLFSRLSLSVCLSLSFFPRARAVDVNVCVCIYVYQRLGGVEVEREKCRERARNFLFFAREREKKREEPMKLS